MRHLCNIRNNNLPCYILTNTKRNRRLALLKGLALYKLSERNARCLLVRNLDSDCRLARYRSLYSYISSGKIKLYIIGKRHDSADLNALLRLNLISCNRRTAAHIRHRNPDAEVR